MEDIYGDLDNYNEADITEELTQLRNENRDLKQKIKEQTSAIIKLQKDFDELASEFKKLEMNYSSLLKTARSEIERKTQIITNLNIEKDTIVLNAIQNKNYYEARRIMGKNYFDAQNYTDPRVWRNEKDQKIKTAEKTKEECKHKGSNDSSKYEDSRKVTSEKAQMLKNMYGETKENQNSKLHTIKASRISNRRKSLPALRCEAELKVSENEYDHSLKQYHSRNHLSLDLRECRSKHRSGRVSETSSAEDKYSSYKESSLETYCKTKHNTYYESEYRKSRHRYEPETHRKHSPDRLLRKATRNHAETQSQENRNSDNNYYTRYGHRSRSRDRRSYYETTKEDHRKHYDRFPGKHKMHDNYSGNGSKRIKHSHTSRYPEEQSWEQEKYYTDEELFQKVIGDIQYTSCQSPDMSFECSAQPIKEIKLNAEFGSTPEDPRIRSRKYTLKKDEDKTVLSTVASELVDLKPINKSVWNIENVQMPEALQHPPSQVLADMIEQNVKLPDTEMTCDDNIDIILQNNKEETHNSNETLNSQFSKSSQDCIENRTSKYKISKHKKLDQTEKNDKLISDLQNKSPNFTDNTLKNKEPEYCIYDQISLPGTNISIEEGELDDSDDLLVTGLTSVRNKSDAQIAIHKLAKSTHSVSKQACVNLIISKHDMPELKDKPKTFSNIEKVNLAVIKTANAKENKRKNDDNTKVKSKVSERIASRYGSKQCPTNKELVAGDLELSDESNDDHDFSQPSDGGLKQNIVSSTATPLPNSKPKIEKTLDSELSKALSAEISVKSPDFDKKNRGKRKSKKSNLSTKKKTSNLTVKKTRQEKVKNTVSTPIKNKFSDLFGDSSSLITPEDLGLATVASEHVNYGPIIEDAQDATDLNSISKPLRLEVETEVSHLEVNQNSNQDNCIKDVISKEVEVPLNNDVDVIIPSLSKNNKETDVIQTVVISTGIQPQFTVPVDVSENLRQANLIAERKAMIALATSTPHKSLSEPNSNLPDVSCSNSNDSRSSSNNNPSVCEKSLSTESRNDDVPDVRIFLKRKRRVIKKTV